MSITSRILLTFTLAAAVVLYLLLDPMIERVERQYLEAAEEPMVDIANVLAEVAAPAFDSSPPNTAALDLAFHSAHKRPLTARIYNLIKATIDLEAYLTDERGVVIWDSAHPERVGADHSSYYDVHYSLQGLYGARSSRTIEEDSTSSVMYVGAPVQRGSKVVGVLSVYKPQKSMALFIDETRSLFRLWGALAMVGFLAAALLLSRWITRPLRRLTDYALSVARGDRPPPPKLQTPDARTLGTAFETMRDALEDRSYVESYVQGLTHEMKSPVAAIRGAAELLEENLPEPERRRFLANIQAETNRLQGLADRLLQLASVERMKKLSRHEPISAMSIAERACANHLDFAASNQVRVELNGDPELHVEGDAGLLEIALSNLISNAIEFSPANSSVQIDVSREAEHARFTVRDSGQGIPEYARSKVFDRFFSLPRPGTGKKSSGLGLCFVREVALLHGGQIEIHQASDAPGTAAALELPLAEISRPR